MAQHPSDLYSPEPNVLERRAAAFLRRTAGGERGHQGRDALRATTRRAVVLALLAGIVSGGLIGGSEVWLRHAVGLEDMDLREALPWWIGWFAVAGIVSAVEIAFLYWVALKGIARVIGTARVELGEDGYPALFARGFARGGLEFPNPKTQIFGIDPYAYVPGWQLVLRTVLYKLKVGVSSFILRVFLRRVATRVAIRGVVPLLAGPLYAAWNAFIIWRIMSEARLRAYGPGAVDGAIDMALCRHQTGEAARRVILHGAGELTRRAADAHPNYVYLISRLREVLEMSTDEDVAVDWDGQRPCVEALKGEERDRVLGFLTLAAVLGTRTSKRQRALVDEAFAAAGAKRKEDALKRLRRQLVDGELDVPSALRSVRVEGRPT